MIFHVVVEKRDSAKLSAKPTTLRSLPLTDEALELNIKHAHFQATMWNNCTSLQQPQKDPCHMSILFLITDKQLGRCTQIGLMNYCTSFLVLLGT